MQVILITAEFLAAFASLYFFHKCNEQHLNWAAAIISLSLLAHALVQLKQIGVQ
jgi:hypothetical protein